MSYLHHYGTRGATPQTEPIPGTTQVPNHAGGYAFSVDDWTRLHRWLILGSSQGTYYVGERTLTRENAEVVERCLHADAARTLQLVTDISTAGRAPSNDQALFALALAFASTDVTTKHLAEEALPRIARTGTHFLHLVAFIRQFRSCGPLVRRAISAWYQDRSPVSLAFQVLKYQSRDGYSHSDVLRLARPKPHDETTQTIFHWIRRGWDSVGEQPHDNPALQQIWAYEKAKQASSVKEVVQLITDYRLPREAVPSQYLNEYAIWDALLPEMPLEALLRNLAKLTRVGVIQPLGKENAALCARLTDAEAITKARLHPLKVLAALTTYQSGKSVRGTESWTPEHSIIDALNTAFYLSFGNVEATGKRLLLAIDVSGSMNGTLVNGIAGMHCHTAAAAMAMVTAKSESTYHVIGFDSSVHPLTVTPTQRLDDIVRQVSSVGGGGTDCALPMEWALQQQVEVDAFVLYSDNETWAGQHHPTEMLAQYRRKVNPQARIINVQMAATHVTTLDPHDEQALEVVGFDTAVPEMLPSFLRGEF